MAQPIGPIYYQSPIDLNCSDVLLKIEQTVSTAGKNKNAIFIPAEKIYQVVSDVRKRRFKLMEYHFHTKFNSEHAICAKKQDAEVHYVFVAIPKRVSNK